MTPSAIRRVTVYAAVFWALAAFVFSVRANFSASGFSTPFETTTHSGRAVVTWASEEARAAGVGLGDLVLSIDGVPYFAWSRDRGWEHFRADEANHYAFETREGRRYQASLAPGPVSGPKMHLVPLYLAGFGVAFAYLGIGVLVWQLRGPRQEAWAFALFCSAMAAQIITAFGTFRPWLGYERALWNLPLLGATMFHLFTTYPFEPTWLRDRPWLRWLPYGLAGALAPLILFERQLGIPSEVLQAVGFFTLVALSLGLIASLAVERYRRRGQERIERADAMLLGAAASFVPVVLLLVVEIFRPTGIPVYLALLWFIVFPVTVAWGIVRRQLFDIRHLARSSAAYGAASLVITGLYAGVVASAELLVKVIDVNARSPQFSLIFIFFAMLAFNPLRSRTQTLVDRLFDRDKARYREAVGEVSAAMVSMLSVREIVERIVVALTGSMGVERSLVLLLSDDERSLRPEARGGSWPEDIDGFELQMDHPICKYLWMRRAEVSRAELVDEPDLDVRDACLEVFERLGVALLVPVLYGVDMLGIIAVGRKVSGERFRSEDRQVLLTLANQSSIAIENAKAFDEIAKLNETLEARVEERTRELQEAQSQLMQSEKMRSLGQLVAGVAHELNNPIGFVHANLKLLDEYVGKLTAAQERGDDVSRPREAIAKLIQRSREGTERVKKIVADLRTFSRMDQADLQVVDLNQEIEGTIVLLEPRCKCGIEIERDFGDLPGVRCHAGQLNQVFLNLMMNACDAMGTSGQLRIRTRSIPDGVRLEFADDGPGIPDAVRTRIFEPFFTTKPVGQGTGLGLSLSHSIIERHGGRIWVESEPGSGTRFVIELPLDAAQAAAVE